MGKTTSDRVAEVKKKATKDVPKIEGVQSAPTGCTLLDLITVERPFGRVVNIVGDKSSGKTFLSIELINACRKKFGDKLKWIYDDAERGFSFDTNELYGFDVIEDMCDPDFIPSETVEKLSVNLDHYTQVLKDDEFLIETSFTGISPGTELRTLSGHEANALTFPLIPGYVYRQRKWHFLGQNLSCTFGSDFPVIIND